jgi:hypothetical protein
MRCNREGSIPTDARIQPVILCDGAARSGKNDRQQHDCNRIDPSHASDTSYY